MPDALVNGVRLHYTVTGEGFPLVFVHEFAGDGLSWEPQVRFFARRYQVITYHARGYPPSGVPEDPAAYSQDLAVADLHGLLHHLGLAQAHLCGLSMGAFAVLHFGLRHPEMARALVVAGCGSGSDDPQEFARESDARARMIEQDGMEVFAADYAQGPTRQPFRRKDPQGWVEFRDAFIRHSGPGSARTLRGVQARRPTIYTFEPQLRRLTVPTMIVNGDQDEPCLVPGLFLNRQIPGARLLVLPDTGHTMNLEEPAVFNQAVLDFLTLVDTGRWPAPDLTPRPPA
jgi:pimeloyl-ACP methyl ester carboxylesterase